MDREKMIEALVGWETSWVRYDPDVAVANWGDQLRVGIKGFQDMSDEELRKYAQGEVDLLKSQPDFEQEDMEIELQAVEEQLILA